MKRVIQSLIFLISLPSFSQVIYIPDATFKQLLTQSTTTYSVAETANGSDIKVDANDDGEIDSSEVANIYYLTVGNQGIYDLTGISAFTNLRVLNCSANILNTLDVSGLAHLWKLECSYNNLTTVNIDGTALREFNCGNNNLTSIAYEQLQNVIHLNISNNNLGPFLTLSSNVLPTIDSLDCSGNFLTSLTITNESLQSLHCFDNLLTSLDTSGMPNLNKLQCGVNQIATLDFSFNSLQFLSCYYNQLTTLELNSQYNLNTVFCQQNPLQSIYIKNGRNEYLYIGGGMTTLHYICADEIQLSTIQSTLNANGYTSCHLDSSCNLSSDNFNEDDDIVIYPNPAKENLNFTVKRNVELSSIRIYNNLGQLVYVSNNKGNTINVSQLAPGTYIIRCQSEYGMESLKFVKE